MQKIENNISKNQRCIIPVDKDLMEVWSGNIATRTIPHRKYGISKRLHLSENNLYES